MRCRDGCDKGRRDHTHEITNMYTQRAGKATERRLKRFWHVRRRSLEHACRKIMDMEPPRRRTTKTRWMDDADRDLNMVDLQRMTADDGKEPSMTIAVAPDDGTSK